MPFIDAHRDQSQLFSIECLEQFNEKKPTAYFLRCLTAPEITLSWFTSPPTEDGSRISITRAQRIRESGERHATTHGPFFDVIIATINITIVTIVRLCACATVSSLPCACVHFVTMAASSSLLSRRLALVTGSTSGIGLGIAVELVKRGHDIILHGLGGSEVVQSAVASCKEALPGQFHHHPSSHPLSLPLLHLDIYSW